jgi:hypothetical protein
MRRRKKRLIILGILVGVFLAALMVARIYILGQIKSKVEQQLHALRDSGYIVRYDSITVDAKKNIVSVYRLSIKRDLDTTLCTTTDFFSAYFIKAEGFKILPLLLKRKLSFESIQVDSPKIVLYKNFFSSRPKEKTEGGEFAINIDRIKLPHVNFSFYDSANCKPNLKLTSNASVQDFVLSFYKDRAPFYNISTFTADSVDLTLPHDFYTFKVREIKLNLALGIFDLDTLRIIPHYNKIAFGRNAGREVDRFEGVVPYINLYGLSLMKEDTIAITVKKMTTRFFLKVFRDKRLPFKNPVRLLPVQALNRLAVGVKIDSLILNKSYASYEEFAEEADSAGRIYFDDIYACLKNINNTDRNRAGKIEMNADGVFMGQGNLHVNAVFPWNTQLKSTVKGSLRDMDFSRLNEMLEPQIRVKAESGRLNDLSFNFSYNNERSHGNLQMDYKDLKLVTFRNNEQREKIARRKNKRKKTDQYDEDDEHIMKAPLKTFVLNAFIIKKNMDGNMPEEKRQGEIEFERDKRRSVFNYWAKSLFSGIKSAYNLDKLDDSRMKKLMDKKD